MTSTHFDDLAMTSPNFDYATSKGYVQLSPRTDLHDESVARSKYMYLDQHCLHFTTSLSLLIVGEDGQSRWGCSDVWNDSQDPRPNDCRQLRDGIFQQGVHVMMCSPPNHAFPFLIRHFHSTLLFTRHLKHMHNRSAILDFFSIPFY